MLSTGSTWEDPSRHTWKIVDLDEKISNQTNIFKIVNRQQQKHEKLPSMQELDVTFNTPMTSVFPDSFLTTNQGHTHNLNMYQPKQNCQFNYRNDRLLLYKFESEETLPLLHCFFSFQFMLYVPVNKFSVMFWMFSRTVS